MKTPMTWGWIHDGPVPRTLHDLSDSDGLTFLEVQPARLRELPTSDCPAIMVSSHADQIALQRQSHALADYLDRGGIVIWNGGIAHPPLDTLKPFVPLAQRSLNHLRVSALCAHPVFSGIPMETLTFRKGVAGFWGRGYNPAPVGARLINGLGPEPAQHPVDWYWQRPGGGEIFMHAGNDLLTFSDQRHINALLSSNLIQWVRKRACALHSETFGATR